MEALLALENSNEVKQVANMREKRSLKPLSVNCSRDATSKPFDQNLTHQKAVKNKKKSKLNKFSGKRDKTDNCFDSKKSPKPQISE